MKKFFEQRKKSVTDFLASYLMDRELASVPVFDEDEDMTTVGTVCEAGAYDKDLAEGQIRLVKDTERITYVVLLRRWEADSFLVMPFSWYNDPATEEEFRCEFDGGLFLRVLQAWNTRTLQDETLEKSWLIGELPEKDMEDAWNFWQYTLGLEDVSDDLLQRSGLPIYDEQDPRIEYKREELKNFAKLDVLDMENAEKCRVLDFRAYLNSSESIYSVFANQEEEEEVAYAMAAGDEEEDLQFTYTIAERGIECSVTYEKAEKQLYIKVYDKDGKRTSALDECQVMDKSSRTSLGVIQDGRLIVAGVDSSSLVLYFADAEGNDLGGNFGVEDDGD